VERRPYSHRVVFGVLAASLALAFAIGLYIHQHFTQYQAKAVSHLPGRVDTALWLNVEQNLGFEVFRDCFLPILEQGRAGPEPRAKRLERKTTLELEVDSREFVFAQVDGRIWVSLLGGLFRRDEVREGIARWLAEENLDPQVREGLVVISTGHAFGVAEDGVLIASNSETVARSALLANGSGRDWKALLDKPGSMLNLLKYGSLLGFDREVRLDSSARRWWFSLEPGAPFPLLIERVDVGPGQSVSGVPGELPFEVDGLESTSGGPGISRWRGTVSTGALWTTVRRWKSGFAQQIWSRSQ
jgi:hypothetical protein